MERKWWTLIVVCIGDLHAAAGHHGGERRAAGHPAATWTPSFSDLQWVVDAYALTLAALLLTAGSLADLLGRRRVFAAGLVLFALASLLCGLATTPTMLDLARGAPGHRRRGDVRHLAGAARPGVRGQGARHRVRRLGRHDRRRRRDRPAASAARSPTGIGWEWIFFVNVPIGVARARGSR